MSIVRDREGNAVTLKNIRKLVALHFETTVLNYLSYQEKLQVFSEISHMTMVMQESRTRMKHYHRPG